MENCKWKFGGNNQSLIRAHGFLNIFVWFFLPDSAIKPGLTLVLRGTFYFYPHTQFITWYNFTNGLFIMPCLGSVLLSTPKSAVATQLQPPINKASHLLHQSAWFISSKSQHSKHSTFWHATRSQHQHYQHSDFFHDITLHLLISFLAYRFPPALIKFSSPTTQTAMFSLRLQRD